MLLENKTAVVFGAGGLIGSQVSRTFAREGASVWLSGRHREPVESVVAEIRAAKGKAEAAEVDALDEKAVNAYLSKVVKQAGQIDMVFNAMGLQAAEVENGRASAEIPFDKFLLPMSTVVASQFLTSRAAAKHMAERRSGVVILLNGTPARGVAPWLAGYSAAFAAIEGLTRCLAVEWGALGIRVVCVRSAGMPETRNIQQTFEIMARSAGAPKEAFEQAPREKPVLKRMPTVAETAAVAAWLGSDRASSLTGAIINSSCGEILD